MTQTAEMPVTSVKSVDLSGWPDNKLVRGCLSGNQDAWSALVRRYQHLIFSVPLKYGFSREEASDIFQAVCIELLSQLPKLKEPRALQKWILMLTSYHCHHRKTRNRMGPVDADEIRRWFQGSLPPETEGIIQNVMREQALRQAMSELSPQCRQFVRFFVEEPARPCADIVKELGLAKGTTSGAQQKCLSQIRRRLGAAKIA